jgi:hypothetical protein
MSRMLTIDKNIPMPEWLMGRNAKYPFAHMEVGDSFFIPGKTAYAIGGAVHNASKRTKYKFVSRTMDGGARVWRIE